MFIKIGGDYVNLNYVDIVRPQTSKNGEARLEVFLNGEDDVVYKLREPAEILKLTEILTQMEVVQLAELADQVREIQSQRAS